MLDKKNTAVLASALVMTMLSGCDDTSISKQSKQSELRSVHSTKCSLGFINDDGSMVTYADGGSVRLVGWAADSNTNTTPPQLNIVLTGPDGKSFVFEGAARNDRPDVVKAFNQDGFLKSGFSLNLDVTALQKATYSVSLQMPTADNLITCKTNKILILK
ncbi:hypothetical protein HBO38_36305 [Pseudomonas veronii]|uniref:Lipoprotein n=1 Tax=Pseudomonas veronii TaxID=76761 RepID=A0A7Y1ADL5_PSEVE|nr:hypothetical protein [Pseudomonas veronii]NMY13771.1 hypothetical protein [Pseudomonas veronii]